MSRRRFYAAPSAFNQRPRNVTLAVDEARYLREVLRLKVGDEVYVFDGEGNEFKCRIEESRRDSASLELLAQVSPGRPESPLQLSLAVALLKSDKFDLVVQKATELGVTRILPVTTKLADIRLRDTADAAKRVLRWQRIALEAAKQSGRAVVPEVTTPIAFESLVHDSDSQGRIVFSEREGQPLQTVSTESSSITALVGSEGGWTDEELDLARESGWTIVTLGGRTLRAETAAIAVATLLQHLCGDLS